MKLYICSVFDSPSDKVWAEVQTTRLLKTIAKPLVTFKPVEPILLPEKWSAGEYVVALYIFTFIPFGQHTIRISFPEIQDHKTHKMRDNGGGDIIPVWDHIITIQKLDDSQTLYKDEVEIKSGWLTLFVWLFANLYYRYRQYKWRKLIQSNFNYSKFYPMK